MTRKRILFVDNRPEHLRQPVLRLQLEGYDVDEAQSGHAGLDALRERPYDLLILDAQLPEEDGWGVLRAVRADPSLADLKVIVFMAPKGETGMLVLVPSTPSFGGRSRIGALLAAVRSVVGSGLSRRRIDPASSPGGVSLRRARGPIGMIHVDPSRGPGREGRAGSEATRHPPAGRRPSSRTASHGPARGPFDPPISRRPKTNVS